LRFEIKKRENKTKAGNNLSTWPSHKVVIALEITPRIESKYKL
jgi:hypothetical protein